LNYDLHTHIEEILNFAQEIIWKNEKKKLFVKDVKYRFHLWNILIKCVLNFLKNSNTLILLREFCNSANLVQPRFHFSEARIITWLTFEVTRHSRTHLCQTRTLPCSFFILLRLHHLSQYCFFWVKTPQFDEIVSYLESEFLTRTAAKKNLFGINHRPELKLTISINHSLGFIDPIESWSKIKQIYDRPIINSTWN